MTDNPTRAKMAILNLTPDEIIEAIKLLPGPSDWRELAVMADDYKTSLERISNVVLELSGLVPIAGAIDINVAAYSFKCTPALASSLVTVFHAENDDKLRSRVHTRFEQIYGRRPYNLDTMEMIFDDNEIP